jgi:Zn-dependent peptidase ImmA (M78 family)
VINAYRPPATILDELGITKPSEIDIEAIAQYWGATIVYEPLDGSAARILGFGDRAVITVDANAGRPRQRFSAGHEFGHWMRDRGKIAFSCTDRSLLREWDADNPERRANRYAADLLLPGKMVEKAARGMPLTFASARELSEVFTTSLVATALRLVELGTLPGMLICTERAGRKWFVRSPLIPDTMWPVRTPGSGSVAYRLLAGAVSSSGAPEVVDADDWIDHPDAKRYEVVEDSRQVSDGLVMTMLWWRNEAQILAFGDDESDDKPDLSGDLTLGPRTRRR